MTMAFFRFVIAFGWVENNILCGMESLLSAPVTILTTTGALHSNWCTFNKPKAWGNGSY